MSVDKKNPSKLGLSRKAARENFERLLNDIAEVRKKLLDLKNQFEAGVSNARAAELQGQMDLLDAKQKVIMFELDWTKDWYSVYLFETLENESRVLRWLTVGLIALTVVLTIFTGFLVSGIRFP